MFLCNGSLHSFAKFLLTEHAVLRLAGYWFLRHRISIFVFLSKIPLDEMKIPHLHFNFWIWVAELETPTSERYPTQVQSQHDFNKFNFLNSNGMLLETLQRCYFVDAFNIDWIKATIQNISGNVFSGSIFMLEFIYNHQFAFVTSFFEMYSVWYGLSYSVASFLRLWYRELVSDLCINFNHGNFFCLQRNG